MYTTWVVIDSCNNLEKQEFRIGFNLFQHVANTWKKVFFTTQPWGWKAGGTCNAKAEEERGTQEYAALWSWGRIGAETRISISQEMETQLYI